VGEFISPYWKAQFMRVKLKLLIAVLGILGSQVLAQNAVLPSSASASGLSFPKLAWPRPFVYGGLGVNGGGYAPLSGTVGAGLRIDRTHLIWEGSASYDNGHKSNDNTANNLKGRDRGLESSIYYRTHEGWFGGGGAGWSQLSTTNYSKQVFNPSIGGGKDYFHKECAAEDCVADWSMRLQTDYKLKGVEHVDAQGCNVPNGQCTNDLQGPMFTLYLPSPALARHLYWRQTAGVYMGHETVTSTDPTLTALQKSAGSVSPYLNFALMYRF
jgi:hypothetical protein